MIAHEMSYARRGGLSLLALFCIGWVLLVDCRVAVAAPPARPLTTGVSYVYDESVAAFEHVQRAGAKLVQTPLRWGDVIAPKRQPASWRPEDPADPNYDWAEYDLWVTRAVQAGLTPVLQVRGAPAWAQRCRFISYDAPCNPDPAALAAFTTAAVRRYSGHFGGLPRVRYWQGLNEPNLSLFFNPQFDEAGQPASPDLYRDLINAFYSAVKSVDPSNLVIAAGLGPIAVPPYTIGPMRFARELLCMRGLSLLPGDCHGGVHFDIFDVHPYTTGGPTHAGGMNDVQMGDLAKLQRLLRAADSAGRIKGAFRRTPLWVTELSWDSNPPDPGGLAMRIESRWTAEALHEAWKAGVSNFFWFSLRDFPPDPDRPFSMTLQSGLYFRGPTVAEDQPKDFLYAFRFPFVAYPVQKGISFWGRTPSSGRGRVTIQLRRRGRWHKAFVARANRYGIFSGVIGTGYGRHKRGAARGVFRKESALPFSMRPVKDFPQPPFG